MASDRASDQILLVVSALLFTITATLTIVWCASMSTMGMPMPGGWTMSMAWMRMPDQTWLAAAAAFLGMWIVMMVAMMLPSLVPMLQRYRVAVAGTGKMRLGWPTVVVGAGYFLVWTVFGVLVFPIGVALAELEMQQPALARAVPMAAGVTLLFAGALQFTRWKARQLACCREELVFNRGASPLGLPDTLSRSPLRRLAPFAWLAPFARSHSGTNGLHENPSSFVNAWRYGLRLGLDCSLCCVGLMTTLLVTGVMDVRVMAAVTAAITGERVAPNGERVARVIGAVIVVAGVVLIASAA